MIKVQKAACSGNIKKKLNAGKNTLGDVRPDAKHWNKHSHWTKAKDALYGMHKGKCCYCERKRDMSREMDIEHYRPKAKVEDDPGHSGYWWLAYEWDNLLLSCKTCNQANKKCHFPIEGQRACGRNASLENEEPLLLNPAIDDPRDYFDYVTEDTDEGLPLGWIKAKGENKRASKTIGLLGLNRVGLVSAREHFLDLFIILSLEEEHRLNLKNHIEREYTGFGKFLCEHFLININI